MIRSNECKIYIIIVVLYILLPTLAFGASGSGITIDQAIDEFEQGNLQSAFRMFLTLDRKGVAKAQHLLGEMYYFGYGVTRDYVTALSWYKKAALKGYVDSQLQLGTMYVKKFNGLNVNFKEGIKWFKKAAKKQSPLASFMLGNIYYKGLGIDADTKIAAYWYEKASMLGNVNAQTVLASMYYEGTGVEKSSIESYKWCLISNKLENYENIYGIKIAEQIKLTMTKEQILKATDLAEEFMIEYDRTAGNRAAARIN